MLRLDARQRRLLSLLSETEWRSTATIAAMTSLYQLHGAGAVLGLFAADGLVERREVGRHNPVSEWRRLPVQSHP